MRKRVLAAGLALSACAQVHAGEGVVLLHGLCRSPASMRKLETALAERGYVVENVGYPSRHGRIDVLSDAAIGQALACERLAGCGRIHFVTHSLGGILVRSYFARHTDSRLGRVVMLGPPNQGSEVVDRLGHWRLFRVLNGPAGGELGTATNARPQTLGPVAFELGVVAGDRSINWINSLMIKGRDDGKVSVANAQVAGMKEMLVVHSAHPFLMKNGQAIAATLRFLESGTFGSAP